MHHLHPYRVCLLIASLSLLAGCGDLAETISKGVEQHGKIQATLDRLRSKCPMKVNSYITLDGVSLDLNELRFDYTVSESGRSEVYLGKSGDVRREIMEFMLSTPECQQINDFKIKFFHVFEDRDDKRMLSLDFTRDELARFKRENGLDLKVRHVGRRTDVTDDPLKAELAQIKHRPSAVRARSWFEAINDECPKAIDDHVTLQYVKFIGTGRIEYRYNVDQEGVKYTNLDFRKSKQAEDAAAMRGTRLGDAIMHLDWSVEHVFKGPKGTQILSYSITRNELLQAASTERLSAPSTSGLDDVIPPGSPARRSQQRIQYNPFVKPSE